jgi:hypothetical protein
VVIPLHWLSTGQALALLGVGAALLTYMAWKLPRLRLQPVRQIVLTVAGILIVALALGVLKDRTSAGVVGGSPHFMVMRNAETLAWAAIPMALAVLRLERGARLLAPALGAMGVGLLTILIWSVVGAWSAEVEGPIRITVTRLPGAKLLERDGNYLAACWLWCLGAAVLTVPGVRAFLRRRRGMSAAQDADLGFTLLGLAMGSLAMGTFFWHESDWADRHYSYLLMQLQAFAAALLVLGAARGQTAVRWMQYVLGAIGAVVATWLLTSEDGGTLAGSDQNFTAAWPAMLLFLLQLLIVALISLQLAGDAILRILRRRGPQTACERSI